MTTATAPSISVADAALCKTPRLLLVVNHAAFLYSHRLPVASRAREAGFDVTLACAIDTVPQDRPAVVALEAAGFPVISLPIDRGVSSLAREFRLLWRLFRLYRSLAPDVVHHVTIRPVLFGSLAARLARVPAVVNAVSGLGFVFLASGRRAALRRRLVVAGYRLAFGHPKLVVIFQNDADADLFLERRIVPRAAVHMIRGSGVELARFTASPLPEGVPIVVLPTRMLVDKGVHEFVAAARELTEAGVGHASYSWATPIRTPPRFPVRTSSGGTGPA